MIAQLSSLATLLCAAVLLAAGSAPVATAARPAAGLPQLRGSTARISTEFAPESSLEALGRLSGGIVSADGLGREASHLDDVATVEAPKKKKTKKKKKQPKKKKPAKKKTKKPELPPPCSQGKCKRSPRSKTKGTCSNGTKIVTCNLTVAPAPGPADTQPRSTPAAPFDRSAATPTLPWRWFAGAASEDGDGLDADSPEYDGDVEYTYDS